MEIENPDEYWYDQWNRMFGPAKGFFAVTGDAVNDAVDWWKNVLGKETDSEVKKYFEDNTTIDSNNNYSFTQEFNNHIIDYSNYFQTQTGSPFIYPCLDVYNKQFKFDGQNKNTSVFESVFKKYGNDYLICLTLSSSNFNTNQYYNLGSSTVRESIRLYPLIDSPIYNYASYNIGTDTRRYFGHVHGEMFYSLDENLNLISNNLTVSSSNELGAMLLLSFYQQNGKTLGIRAPWVNYSFTYRVPICYRENKTIQLYFGNSNLNNSIDGVNVNLNNVYWNNGAPVTRSDQLPTIQDINDYSNYVETITGDTVDSHDVYNYVTNIYPSGNDYTNEPLVTDKPGGLLTSLGDGLGTLGTLIGTIIGSIINALVNVLLGILNAFVAVVNIFTSAFPSSFRQFMEVFTGLFQSL